MMTKARTTCRAWRMQALNVIYHSPICLPAVRDEIRDFLISEDAIEPGAEPPRERIYPPVDTLALDIFFDELAAEAESFRQVGRRLATGLLVDPPIRRPDLSLPFLSDTAMDG